MVHTNKVRALYKSPKALPVYEQKRWNIFSCLEKGMRETKRIREEENMIQSGGNANERTDMLMGGIIRSRIKENGRMRVKQVKEILALSVLYTKMRCKREDCGILRVLFVFGKHPAVLFNDG